MEEEKQPPSIDVDKYFSSIIDLSKTFFSEVTLNKIFIDSYEYCLRYTIPEIIESNKFEFLHESQKYRIKFTNVFLLPPMRESVLKKLETFKSLTLYNQKMNDIRTKPADLQEYMKKFSGEQYANKRYLPYMIRQNSSTYNVSIYANVVLLKVDEKDEDNNDENNGERYVYTKVLNVDFVLLGEIPLMLGTAWDWIRLGDYQKADYALIQESIHDPFGYFIIGGNRKVYITQEKLETNQVFCVLTSDGPSKPKEIVAEIRSESRDKNISKLVISMKIIRDKQKLQDSNKICMIKMPFTGDNKINILDIFRFYIIWRVWTSPIEGYAQRYQEFVKDKGNDFTDQDKFLIGQYIKNTISDDDDHIKLEFNMRIHRLNTCDTVHYAIEELKNYIDINITNNTIRSYISPYIEDTIGDFVAAEQAYEAELKNGDDRDVTTTTLFIDSLYKMVAVKFKDQIEKPTFDIKIEHIKRTFDNEFFPHIPVYEREYEQNGHIYVERIGDYRKGFPDNDIGLPEDNTFQFHRYNIYIGMIVRFIKCFIGKKEIDDRDHFGNKKIETIGISLGILFSKVFKSTINRLSYELPKMQTNFSVTEKVKENAITLKSTIERACKGNLTKIIYDSFNTGNWGLKQKRKGSVQAMDKTSLVAQLAILRKLSIPMKKQSKHAKPREIHPSQFGLVCTISPENESCGLIKEIAVSTYITNDDDDAHNYFENMITLLIQYTELAIMSENDKDITEQFSSIINDDQYKILLNTLRRQSKIVVENLGKNTYDYIKTILTNFVEKDPIIVSNRSDVYNTPLFLDRQLKGYCKSDVIFEFFTKFKRLPFFSNRYPSVFQKKEIDSIEHSIEIHILTNSGRAIRPLFVINNKATDINDYLPILKFIDEHRNDKTQLTFNKVFTSAYRIVDYISAHEAETVFIAPKLQYAINRFNGHNNLPDYNYLEIDPYWIMGTSIATGPFPGFMPNPRVTYYGGQSRQTIGIPGESATCETETELKVIRFSEKPLVQTDMASIIGLDQLPTGLNMKVAIISYGYNQEDGIIFNRKTIDMGFFHSSIFETAKDDYWITGDPSLDQHVYKDGIIREKRIPLYKRTDLFDQYRKEYAEYLSNMENKTVTPDKISDAELLDYLRRKESEVMADVYNSITIQQQFKGQFGVISGAGSTFINPKDNDLLAKSKKTNTGDSKMQIKGKMAGYVHRVYHDQRDVHAKRVLKVVVRYPNIPGAGDKFASRYAQKGVIGKVVDPEDMPFDPVTGETPDIIINPASLPSRMTIGMLIEMLVSKTAAVCNTQNILERLVTFSPMRRQPKINQDFYIVLEPFVKTQNKILYIDNRISKNYREFLLKQKSIVKITSIKSSTDDIMKLIKDYNPVDIIFADKGDTHLIIQNNTAIIYYKTNEENNWLIQFSNDKIARKIIDKVGVEDIGVSLADVKDFKNIIDDDIMFDVIYSQVKTFKNLDRLDSYINFLDKYDIIIKWLDIFGKEFEGELKWGIRLKIKDVFERVYDDIQEEVELSNEKGLVTQRKIIRTDYKFIEPSDYYKLNLPKIGENNIERVILYSDLSTEDQILYYKMYSKTLVAGRHVVNSDYYDDELSKARDATAFRTEANNIDKIGEILKQKGFASNGKAVLHDGVTGKMMLGKIFTGQCYYMALKHIVNKKYQYRNRGKIDSITRQPVRGKSKEGAVRNCEMSKTALLAHGVTAFLRERFLYASDEHTAQICGKIQDTGGVCGGICYIKSNKYICERCGQYDNTDTQPYDVILPYSLILLSREISSFGAGVRINVRPVYEQQTKSISMPGELMPEFLTKKFSDKKSSAKISARKSTTKTTKKTDESDDEKSRMKIGTKTIRKRVP